MAPPSKPMDEAAKNNERNEYIPSFISKKPFYAEDITKDDDYLQHQRLQKKEADSKWYERGRKLGSAATKFRKGACENCGAMGHQKKDCLSRPRKAGAKWTGRDIQADERQQDVSLGWDAKRDRWNGYDSSEYSKVVEGYKQLEAMKKATKSDQDGDSEADQANDEDAKYEAETDMGRNQATSTRNLRLREDTAKYLLSLDPESARYDPKTRTMLDGGTASDKASALVAEEGFMRASGDAAEFEKATRYAWENEEKGGNKQIHMQAMPTAGEYLRKKEIEAQKKEKEETKQALLAKYGSQAKFQEKPPEIAETERYVEYDEKGKIKGAPEKKVKSKYAEDVFINNHTSVWGSWWSNFKWGYACCHSMTKNSYCTGDEGKRAFEESSRLRIAESLDTQEVPKSIAWKEEAAHEEHVPNGVEKDSKQKLDQAAREKRSKRTIDQMTGGATEEEMEDYRRKRVAHDDPMAEMLGRDELVK
ncbi:MAG: sla2 Src-like adaptor 2 [Bogoriella megaspora]|nr:MAG: sla2 Src-like adaptor 2 [Bogoriella megaspora]